MKPKQIRTLEDAELFCTGLLNDFEQGIMTKGQCLADLRDYTFHLQEMFFQTSKRKIGYALLNDKNLLKKIPIEPRPRLVKNNR